MLANPGVSFSLIELSFVTRVGQNICKFENFVEEMVSRCPYGQPRAVRCCVCDTL